jgi:hypothetical protein
MTELDGPNRIHRRTLSRLARLDESLRQWNTTPARADVVAKLKARVAQVCEKSFGNQLTDAADEAHCMDFGAVTAAN